MAFTKLTKDLDVIQKLDDEPNDVGGLTAAELKKKFDDSGNAIKDYLNETLVPELDTAVGGKTSKGYVDAEIAKCIPKTGGEVGGTFTVSGGPVMLEDYNGAALVMGNNGLYLQAEDGTRLLDIDTSGNEVAIHYVDMPKTDGDAANKKYVDQQVASASAGAIPDGAITTAKLADKAVTAGKLATDISGSFNVAGLELCDAAGGYWSFKDDGTFTIENAGGSTLLEFDPINERVTLHALLSVTVSSATSPSSVSTRGYVDSMIKTARPFAHSVVLDSNDWDDVTKQQTVTCSGVLADEKNQFILTTPKMADAEDYRDSGCLCVTRADGSLTFQCDVIPDDDITVYIAIMPVNYS